MIETQRLILRAPQRGDEKPLNAAINRSLSALQRWLPWAKVPSLAPTKRYVENGIANWASSAHRDFPLLVIVKATQQ